MPLASSNDTPPPRPAHFALPGRSVGSTWHRRRASRWRRRASSGRRAEALEVRRRPPPPVRRHRPYRSRSSPPVRGTGVRSTARSCPSSARSSSPTPRSTRSWHRPQSPTRACSGARSAGSRSPKHYSRSSQAALTRPRCSTRSPRPRRTGRRPARRGRRPCRSRPHRPVRLVAHLAHRGGRGRRDTQRARHLAGPAPCPAGTVDLGAPARPQRAGLRRVRPVVEGLAPRARDLGRGLRALVSRPGSRHGKPTAHVGTRTSRRAGHDRSSGGVRC
jgi:hypothetical protein